MSLNNEIKRFQQLLASISNGIHTVVYPKFFVEVSSPCTTTVAEGIACTKSTKQSIHPLDWQGIVCRATEINKANKGKAEFSEQEDIVSGRLIALRTNGQSIAVAVLKENITRETLQQFVDLKANGYSLSFVLPTHSKVKQINKKKVKKRTTTAVSLEEKDMAAVA